MLNLKNKIFLVTGASSGIGRATCIKISECGGNMIITGRNSNKLDHTKQLCRSKSIINTFCCDLSVSNDISNLVDFIALNNIKLDGVVNSAGIDLTKPFKLVNEINITDIFKINVFSIVLLINGLLNKKLLNRNSSIIFISSIASIRGTKFRSAYSSSKSALIGLCKSLAIEYSAVPYRFNLVMPGVVKTDMIEKLFESIPEDSKNNIIAMYPLGLGEPEDIASLIVFLLSDEARWITGSEFIIDGGFSA